MTSLRLARSVERGSRSLRSAQPIDLVAPTAYSAEMASRLIARCAFIKISSLVTNSTLFLQFTTRSGIKESGKPDI